MMSALLNYMIEQDAKLSARRTLDTMRYVLNRWNPNHTEPINSHDLHLFLCDERHGTLTAEQKEFIRMRRAEMQRTYEAAVFRLLQLDEMLKQKYVSSLCDFCMTVLSKPIPESEATFMHQAQQNTPCTLFPNEPGTDTPKK